MNDIGVQWLVGSFHSPKIKEMNLSNTELTGNTFHRMMPSLHSLILDCCSSLNGQGLYSIAKRYNYMLLHNWDWCFKLMYNLSSHIFLKSLNHSFVYFGWLFWIFVYLLAAKTSASQAGPKFKTVCQMVWKKTSRDFKKIWLLLVFAFQLFEFEDTIHINE